MAVRYPPATAASWDRVGLVVGDPDAPVGRILAAVDCVPETIAEAVAVGADFMVVHHPLLLRGVHSVATTTYKGRAVHDLIRSGIGLLVAHTNADVATPGVNEALAARLGLIDVLPIKAEESGRIGTLSTPMTLAEFARHVAGRLPATAVGVRAAGDPDRIIRRVAVCGGAGDFLLADVAAAGVDAFVTADLRHHLASEHLADGGPALVDAAHWATERPWLDPLAEYLRAELGLEVIISDLVTDVWTVHSPSEHPDLPKESPR